jgi:hypothetical protein
MMPLVGMNLVDGARKGGSVFRMNPKNPQSLKWFLAPAKFCGVLESIRNSFGS